MGQYAEVRANLPAAPGLIRFQICLLCGGIPQNTKSSCNFQVVGLKQILKLLAIAFPTQWRHCDEFPNRLAIGEKAVLYAFGGNEVKCRS